MGQYSINVTWKLFTFSLFIFTICSKLPFLLREALWTSKIQNLYILMVKDGDVLPHFQFLGSHSAFFRCAISLFQISGSASLRFYSCFYDEVVQYRLNPHGYSFDFVSDVDCNIFQPRIQNFQAEKIIVSCRENFMLDTRIHFIPYENEVYSRKEWSVFS